MTTRDTHRHHDGRLLRPGDDGIDFYESLEGMRVQVNDVVAVGPDVRLRLQQEIPVVDAAAGAAHAPGGVIIEPA